MEINEKVAEFFRNEVDYTTLMEDAALAQAQLVFMIEKLSALPEGEQPATNHISDFLIESLHLIRLLRPEE